MQLAGKGKSSTYRIIDFSGIEPYAVATHASGDQDFAIVQERGGMGKSLHDGVAGESQMSGRRWSASRYGEKYERAKESKQRQSNFGAKVHKILTFSIRLILRRSG